ncbi:Crp/Fnr family transcriptional regulator [Pseudomonas sp. NBRC 111118]|uniref:Crp/Fnr family transcriptional regulator n=1 Tax=Pseudomonas sp. NBRC 111118 TaxID=1661033 RepID=UPI0006D3DEA1|nr:Crp/Fnr family transcriptional regulator [Pseudomonas sp. NBRC 111118]
MSNGDLDFYCRCKKCKGFGLGWINHIDGTWVRVHRSYIDGFFVDTTTGEILRHDDASSIYAGRHDYKRSLADCRSIDDFDEHIEHVDLRKLPPRNKALLDTMQAQADWVWKNSNKTIDGRITAPVMKTLKVLERAIVYRNMLVVTQADLAKMLGVTTDNLMQKLKPLRDRGLIRVRTRTARNGVRKGEVILTVNPRFIFRGDDWFKNHYATAWYEADVDVNDLVTLNPVPKPWTGDRTAPDGFPPCTMQFTECTAEQLELKRQGRYVEYGESVRAMRLAQMELPLQLAA